MKKIAGMVLAVMAVALFWSFIYFTFERDPAYKPHPTTWMGKSGHYGCLHRDGWYSFYNQHGTKITSLPAGEAFHLH